MPITADCHLHSSFSGDSDTPMEEMILQGISRGLTAMCFTEHNDFDYPKYPDLSADAFLLDTDACLCTHARLKEKYAEKIRLLIGVELGLQTFNSRANTTFAQSHAFDFILASSHICCGLDPYYPGFFDLYSKEEGLAKYFESILENVKKFSSFDVYGHLDYIVRYAPGQDKDYSSQNYGEILDEILKTLIEKGKGIELNTGGIKHGMHDFHPCKDILKRFKELGGEIITIGSDSHNTKDIGAHFAQAAQTLLECGFRYYCVFEKRRPQFYRL